MTRKLRNDWPIPKRSILTRKGSLFQMRITVTPALVVIFDRNKISKRETLRILVKDVLANCR